MFSLIKAGDELYQNKLIVGVRMTVRLVSSLTRLDMTKKYVVIGM